MTSEVANKVAIVVIGRNEGDRLRACLGSLETVIHRTIYVDSGSNDGSVELARSSGALTELLDMTRPFTAARARNAGFSVAEDSFEDIEYVQFVDGDCTLDSGWLERATQFLDLNPKVAIVFGRRRERFPARSVYNRLCDIEWNTPVGPVAECGGDILMRASAFRDVGGYSNDLIAGEEPEMCVRLRASGWNIQRLDVEMTMHDANIMMFRQWWVRAKRGGHAFAEVSARHANSPYGIWQNNVRRAYVWGLLLPGTILLISVLLSPWLLVLFLVYPLQVVRLALRRLPLRRESWEFALFTVLSKFPEMIGANRYYFKRSGKRELIEYK